MIFAILLIVLVAVQCQEENLAVTRDFEQQLRAQKMTWTVASYEENVFRGWTLDEVRGFLGVRRPIYAHAVPQPKISTKPDTSLPDDFDSRKQWPKCFNSIRNQGDCGSCWAMGISEMMESRHCVQCGGKNLNLSPQDFVSCDKADKACKGGDFEPALKYATNTGIVTENCFSYVSGSGNVPTCPTNGKCEEDDEPYVKYKCKAGTSKNYGPDRNAIKTVHVLQERHLQTLPGRIPRRPRGAHCWMGT